MNTVATLDVGPSGRTSERVRRPSALLNLIRKECQDSREALIVGLVVFWLGPALLDLLWLPLNRDHETFPIAWGLLMLAGWLYAVIVGAHTVCRDWGKPEEHFLLAQPVSPRAVVGAKLVTGAAVLAGVILVVVAWDAMLAWWGAFGRGLKPTPENVDVWQWARLTTVSVTCIMTVAYALAFAFAVITRQMLASTMVASLAVLVWAVAPLLSSRLTFFCAPFFMPEESRATVSGLVFVLVSTLGLVAFAATSFFCSTRERVLRLGHKQLAWTIALVMLALFGVAMTEIGNSLTVRDQSQLFDSSRYGGPTRAIERGDRFFFLQHLGPTQIWEMATFRVADNGRIQDLRRAEVPGARLSGDPQDGQQLTGFAFDESGHLVVSGERWRVFSPRQYRLENSWRTTLFWGDRGEPEVLSHAELKLPTDKHLTSLDGYWWDNASTVRYTYVASIVGEGRSEHKDRLYVFDWSEGLNPVPRFEVLLPQDAIGVSVSRGEVRVWARWSKDSKDELGRVATFDANHPETLLDTKNWTFHAPNYRYEWGQFERPGSGYIYSSQVDEHGQVAYLSDRLGLRVAQRTPAGRWEIVGGYSASPLAMLSRLGSVVPKPKAFDDSLLIERCNERIVAYDVSKPTRPRRIGYFNSVDLYGSSDTVFATQRYLVLREFNLITVLDRPDQRGKNNP